MLVAEANLHTKLDLSLDWRRVDQHLVRRDNSPQRAAGKSGKFLGTPDQKRIGLPRQSIVGVSLLEKAVLGDTFIKPPRGAEQPLEQLGRRPVTGAALQLRNPGAVRQAKQRIEIKRAKQQKESSLQHGRRRA